MTIRPGLNAKILAIITCAVMLAGAARADIEPGGSDGPFKPLPEEGPVPPIYDRTAVDESLEQRRHREAQHRQHIEQIRREHFHRMRNPEIRRKGMEELRDLTDPAAFRPMFEVLADESDEVLKAVFDHLAGQGDEGQAALVWIGIHQVAGQTRTRDAQRLHHAVMQRLEQPVSNAVLREFDTALRRTDHHVVNQAGRLAGMLNVTEAIPLLMLNQVAFRSSRSRPAEGEIEWYYVGSDLIPVRNLSWITQSDAGDFNLVPGTRTTGVVTRERDGVEITYRMDVHNTLVRLASDAIGESTRGLGFDMWQWYEWYNETYVPHMNRQAGRRRSG